MHFLKLVPQQRNFAFTLKANLNLIPQDKSVSRIRGFICLFMRMKTVFGLCFFGVELYDDGGCDLNHMIT